MIAKNRGVLNFFGYILWKEALLGISKCSSIMDMKKIRKVFRIVLLGAVLLGLSLGYKLFGEKNKPEQGKTLLFNEAGAEPGPAPGSGPAPGDDS